MKPLINFKMLFYVGNEMPYFLAFLGEKTILDYIAKIGPFWVRRGFLIWKRGALSVRRVLHWAGGIYYKEGGCRRPVGYSFLGRGGQSWDEIFGESK